MSILTYRPLERDGRRGLLEVETGRWIEPLIGAKGDTQMPPPSPEETALKQKQLELLNMQQGVSQRQVAEQESLAPYLYNQMGLVKTTGQDTGAISSLQAQIAELEKNLPVVNQTQQYPGPGLTPGVTQGLSPEQLKINGLKKQLAQLQSVGADAVSFRKMSQEELRAQMSPEEAQAADIRDLANQRTKKALEGNLDVDPAVEQDIQRGESQLRQELLQKLGPGAEGSDSWNRAMSEFQRNMNTVRYSVRHGEMTTADALATNRVNESLKRQDQALRHLKGATDPYSSSAQTLATASQGIGSTIGQYYGERVNAADLSMQGSGIRNAFWGNMIGAGMGAAGMAVGGLAV